MKILNKMHLASQKSFLPKEVKVDAVTYPRPPQDWTWEYLSLVERASWVPTLFPS